MIPKIIHYCWFGWQEKPESVQRCIKSWKLYLPDYQINEWNESNFDISASCDFVREAAALEKWAFVSDFVRIFALQEFGGVYMDTDVIIKNSLDEFLDLSFFLGMENDQVISTALIGACKAKPILQEILDYYYRCKFSTDTNNTIITSILISDYGLKKQDTMQTLKDGIFIYPSWYFVLDLPKNYATHYFSNSWQPDQPANRYKNTLHIKYFVDELTSIKDAKTELNNLINNQKALSVDKILDMLPYKNIVRYAIKQGISKLLSYIGV